MLLTGPFLTPIQAALYDAFESAAGRPDPEKVDRLFEVAERIERATVWGLEARPGGIVVQVDAESYEI